MGSSNWNEGNDVRMEVELLYLRQSLGSWWGEERRFCGLSLLVCLQVEEMG